MCELAEAGAARRLLARRAERPRCGARGAAAARAIDAGAGVLVSWGLAGGLDATLAPGTVVVPRRVLQQGAEPLAVDAVWHSRRRGAGR